MTTAAANRTRVDVFIPCYNYGRYLRACVASAMQPDGPPVRILIIDDASTDDTPAIAARLAADHPNVTYVRHARNLGHIGTYNQGVRWARSEFFQFLSADDLLAPGSLKRAVTFFDAHPETGMVYGRTRKFYDETPAAMPAPHIYRTTLLDGQQFLRRAAITATNPIWNPSAVLVRTALQQAIGGYLHALPHSGDMEMWFRFAAHAPVGFLDVDQGLYRCHADNMSLGYQNLNDFLQRFQAWESICSRYRDRIPDHAALMRVVRRTLAAEVFWKAVVAFEHDDSVNINEHLSLATTLDPRFNRTAAWWRFRFKRLLGRKLAASLLSSIRDRRSPRQAA
jgi:glycosyltransferase involved in cell wall biosynthesis